MSMSFIWIESFIVFTMSPSVKVEEKFISEGMSTVRDLRRRFGVVIVTFEHFSHLLLLFLLLTLNM